MSSMLDPMDKIEAARELTETVLYAQKAFSDEQRKKSKEIYQYAKENKLFDNLTDVFHSEDSLAQYISLAKNKDNSIIVKPQGKQGYFLSQAQQQIIKREVESQKEEKNEEKKERDKEKILYPVLEKWLQAQGTRTKDTSQTKTLGKWSNPDISGLRISEFIGTKELEITTIEAKISIDSWEYNIFEAISHKRYANRAYFAFAHPLSLVGSLPSNMRYYCELYEIGLLLISMDDKLYERYIAGGISKLGSDDDYDVAEIFTAPYSYVQVKWQKEYCQAIGIKETENLYTWGNILSE